MHEYVDVNNHYGDHGCYLPEASFDNQVNQEHETFMADPETAMIITGR